jgi:hypothetical protein
LIGLAKNELSTVAPLQKKKKKKKKEKKKKKKREEQIEERRLYKSFKTYEYKDICIYIYIYVQK